LDFHRKQQDLDERLQSITGSDTSDEAVKRFESRMTKVRRLEIASGYLEVIQEVDVLSRKSRSALKQDPRSALRAYTGLRSLSNGLKQAQPEAEGAAPHLVDQVETQANTVEEELRTGLVKDFRSTLEKMKWPQKELKLTSSIMSTFTEQAQLLLELQEPDLLSRTSLIEDPNLQPTVLLPLEVMVQPLAQRFRYHFFGDRPTNRLDKPEYFLSHILDLLDRHSIFVSEAFQPILDHRIQASDELENVYADAVSSFITALLPLVMTKSLSVLPQMSSHPQLLSHFIHELMSLDNTLRETWGYNPTPGVFSDWKGTTWSILITHNYFNTWLGVEKEFALSRYKTIRDAPDATDIDYEGVSPSQTKPTKGTIRVNDLLETVTDRYRSLSSFSQKMKFLIDIQLSIFDDYHNYLHAALQAYLASSHTAGRLLQGQSKSEALGHKGLVSLCKIYGSAEYLERKMSDWADDLFFLELWEELQDRAQNDSTSMGGSVGHDLRVGDVAAETSSTIRKVVDTSFETDGGALFDETAIAYQRLKEHGEDEILRLLDVNVQDAIMPYSQTGSWASLSTTTSNPSDLAPSASLDSILQTISTLLGFLSKVLAAAPMRKMVKHFCSTLQTEIYDSLMMKQNFSAAGAAQLKRDLAAIENAVDSTCSSQGVGAAGMRKLNQALLLLGLPIKQSSSRHLSGKNVSSIETAEDVWGFDDSNDEDESLEDSLGDSLGDTQEPETAPTATSPSDDDSPRSLWAAERQIFLSNEAARQALAEMGLDLLSEADARNILKRRVEISS
jgi:RAD50-interacting protein 1